MCPYISTYTFLFCKIIVWYKKINSIIMRIQKKIIKRIIFAFFFTKSQIKKKKKKLLIYNYVWCDDILYNIIILYTIIYIIIYNDI